MGPSFPGPAPPPCLWEPPLPPTDGAAGPPPRERPGLVVKHARLGNAHGWSSSPPPRIDDTGPKPCWFHGAGSPEGCSRTLGSRSDSPLQGSEPRTSRPPRTCAACPRTRGGPTLHEQTRRRRSGPMPAQLWCGNLRRVGVLRGVWLQSVSFKGRDRMLSSAVELR
ncbi:MAG: hypothetical protein BIP78_0176 [Candidatus Bipolaricaulis sibiricus]|uniref:Uncharacterized protein n=1 Tax=Bipolaricaulis sibiricus TaxID=2501609 RepID=A0A410FSH8_BIPS1|nr:MAG: hypothetical protein BIP78_0176 [Candidatus Bipolaricaulis sibiricus]